MFACSKNRYQISLLLRTHLIFLQNSNFSLNFNEKVIKHFENTFDISRVRVQSLMLRWPSLRNTSEMQINSVIETFNEFGITKENVIENPKLLNFHSFTLKTRLLVLMECGFININTTILSRYVTLISMRSLAELKRAQFLDKDIEIWENLINCFNNLSNVQFNLPIDVDLDSKTLCEIRIEILRQFLKAKYNISDYTFNLLLQRYPLIKHRSFKTICKTLDIIENELHFPKDRIISNGFLIGVNPENISKIISDVKVIGNTDIKKILYKYPLLIKTDFKSILKMKEIFKNEGISDESQKRCPEIFSLSTNTVQKRITEFKASPNFIGFFHNPRMLQLIYYRKKISKRLLQLEIIKKRCSSLHKLVASDVEFSKFSSTWGDKTKGTDILKFLNQFTSHKSELLKLQKTLSRHPFWLNTPLRDVASNLEYLQQHYSLDDIFHNCQLLLYPTDSIKNYIKIINSTEVDHKYSFVRLKKVDRGTPTHRDCTLFDFQIDKLSNKQILSLCLYLMEQDNHYTGDGVWDNEKIKNSVAHMK